MCWQSNASGEKHEGEANIGIRYCAKITARKLLHNSDETNKKKSYGTDMGKAQETEVENWVVRSDNIK